jgi:hypothetical protein
MQLEMGSTPAPGVATRRPRRVAATVRKSLNGEFVRAAQKVTGEGASHSARGGRAPLSLNRYGLDGMRGPHAFCVNFTPAGPRFVSNIAQNPLAWFLLSNLD